MHDHQALLHDGTAGRFVNLIQGFLYNCKVSKRPEQLIRMESIDLKSASVNGYIAEFLKEIDRSFLNPDFDSYDLLLIH